MAVILHKLKRNLTIVLTLIWCLSVTCTAAYDGRYEKNLDSQVNNIMKVMDKPLPGNKYELANGAITLRRGVFPRPRRIRPKSKSSNSSSYDLMLNKVENFARTHHVDIALSKLIPTSRSARFSFGKNNFLTGFGLGFLAFGLKKLLLPLFIGAQIIKSILIAMFLPSILGSVGKLVGKGVTTFAQSSGSSNFANAGSDNINDFDFKDTGTAQTNDATADPAGSESAYNSVWAYPTAGVNNMISNTGNGILPYQDIMANYLQQYQQQQQQSAATAAAGPHFYSLNGAGSLFGNGNEYANSHTKPTAITRFTQKPKEPLPNKYYSGNFYNKDKTEDFKVFHNIPTSSHLLANYDPFYSPLLSRIDSVFKQLGYTAEACRERLVCNMYKNPTKYAPFSNLVSAQLSRELNELRKPSSDNPEILRFFRYMKAAKDGQDNQECDILYSECTTSRASSETAAPMVSNFNDINRLVQARST